jgi:hypothetical protein
VLECYAYYLPGAARVADRGTLLRFVERSAPRAALPLPGLAAVAAAYDGSGAAAYADHWVRQKKGRRRGPLPSDVSHIARLHGVSSSTAQHRWCGWLEQVSNVVDRGRFLETLEDCLGFTPKV